MNEQTHIEASPERAEAGGSDEGSDAQSRTAGTAGKSTTFLHRLSGLFRPRNGSSIREDLADRRLAREQGGSVIPPVSGPLEPAVALAGAANKPAGGA